LLRLRLQRGGKKGQPHFRIVLQEHTDAVKREAKEVLGYYQPALDPKVIKVDLERVKHWLSQGAQPSDALAVLLKKEGMEGMDQYIAPRDKQRKKKGEQPEEEAAPAAPAAEAAPAEDKPAEEPKAEEAPAEEPKAEEAPAEEPKAEEAPKEEAPAEEKPAEEEPAPAEEEKPAE
jgi:small subunit ribosomal protein S16